MPKTLQEHFQHLRLDSAALCYIALPIGMVVSNAYGLMILALPIVFMACYICSLTLCGAYQQALAMIPQFAFCIALVYCLASIHPATGAFHNKFYMGIAVIAFCYWLYYFVRDFLHYWRQRDRS